jgi:hypothetical protein
VHFDNEPYVGALPISFGTSKGEMHSYADPLESLGFLVFLRLGFTTTGYHDDDESQRTLVLFKEGARAELLSEATTPDLSRYR